jgi:hypothetical protein
MQFFLIALIVIVIIVSLIFGSLAAKKRREEMLRLAQSLGLEYRPGNDYSFDEQFPFINKLCQGSNRYAFNIIWGQYHGHDVQVFDYHYETSSTDSKGRRKTHHHYFSFFILQFNNSFPELIITHENWLSKAAQFFGYDDIDFESAEFSSRFCVRSPVKKFAYDICNARMIDYLLMNQDLDIEIEHCALTLFFSSRLTADQVAFNLDRLLAVRQLFPAYLFDNLNRQEPR